MKRTHYTVIFERDLESNWWVAQVKEEPGALTQGRTLVEARRRIREALAVLLDEEDESVFVLENDIKLPSQPAKLVADLAEKRAQLAELQRLVAERELAAAAALKKIKISLRDTGALLMVSKDRANELIRKAQPTSSKRERRARA